MISHKGLHLTFHAICLLVTFSMLMYGAVKFIKDESTSIVDFQVYHNREEDIYPTISLCFFVDNPEVPWYEGNLAIYNANEPKKKYNIDQIDKLRDYVRFLMGQTNTIIGINEILEVNYDEVTLDLKDYLKRINVGSGDRVLYEWPTNNSNPMPFYISYRHGTAKCFSIDISDEVMPNIKGKAVSNINIEFFANNDLFSKRSEVLLGYLMHYPKQLIRSTVLAIDHLGIASRYFKKIFAVDNVEVIRRRNTRTSPCNEEYKQDDNVIQRKLIEKVGCSPPHWPFDTDYPRCTTINQMVKILTPPYNYVDSEFLKNFDPPCNQIQTIAYTFDNLEGGPPDPPAGEQGTPSGKQENVVNKSPSGPPGEEGNPGEKQGTAKQDNLKTKSIDIIFKNPNYKQIQHVKSFDIESFIGNVGGYVGLFLGCAFWQAPDFMEFLLRKSKGIVTHLSGDDDENVNDAQHQRNDRACKGRRYQEFKDQALGRKGSRNNSRHRSGDRNSLDGNDTPSNHNPEAMNTDSLGSLGDAHSHIGKEQKLNALPLSVQQKQPGKSVSVLSPQPFDVEKELNAIPALSLEVFQQKVLNSRQQQTHGQGRAASISPTQNSVSVSLTPTTIVNTNHIVAGTPVASIPHASMAIVNTQSSATVSYHPQALVVTKQPPNATIVASGLPLSMIGSKRPLASTSTTMPSVVPVITSTAISNYQNRPQEQHQMQLQHVGRGGGKFSKRITAAGRQET